MKKILRGLAAFISGVAAFYSAIFFVLWVDGAWLVSTQLPEWISLVFALGVCAAVGRYVWTRTGSAQRGLATSIVLGALIMGGIGFIAGFIGPMIYKPDNNLGPMCGIFIAGPWGFVAGGVGGCLYWLVRR
jgi:hypothetical protein